MLCLKIIVPIAACGQNTIIIRSQLLDDSGAGILTSVPAGKNILRHFRLMSK